MYDSIILFVCRLKYSTKGHLTISGFSEPADADADDIELWYPQWPLFEPAIGIEMAKYVIENVGDRFCELVEQEKEAMSWVKPDVKIAWKRAVQGVREMCDVCDTTLFNMHWVCHKCGFVACIDCYRLRKKKGSACSNSKCKSCMKDGGQRWLTCSANRQSHEPDKLMITQIIPSDALWVLGRMIHEVRDKWHIKANCPCGLSSIDTLLNKNGVSPQINHAAAGSDSKVLLNGISDSHQAAGKKTGKPSGGGGGSGSGTFTETTGMNGDNLMSPLSMLAEAAASRESSESKIAASGAGGDDGTSPCSTLRDLLTRENAMRTARPRTTAKTPAGRTLEDIIQKVAERQGADDAVPPKRVVLQHYVPKNGASYLGRAAPIPCYTLQQTSLQFPDIKHEWLDGGRLLRLLEPHCSANLPLFQQQWRRGQVSYQHFVLSY